MKSLGVGHPRLLNAQPSKLLRCGMVAKGAGVAVVSMFSCDQQSVLIIDCIRLNNSFQGVNTLLLSVV